MALEPEWKLCADDWAAFDLKHVSCGYRMQVKQSAAEQTWITGAAGRSSPRFSIAEKTGRYEGATWVPEIGRNADIFVFAWHPKTGAESDHVDSTQWQFYVVAENELPAQKSIGLRQIQRLTVAVDFAKLRQKIDFALAKLIK